jgi:Ca2+-binding RTX toxin-like protein
MPNQLASLTSSSPSGSFTGTSAVDDYITFDRTSSVNGYSTNVILPIRKNADGTLTFTAIDVPKGTYQNFTLPALSSPSAVEYFEILGVTVVGASGKYKLLDAGTYKGLAEERTFIFGGDQADTIEAPSSSNTFSILSGGGGDDVLTGGSGMATFYGGTGKNTLFGNGTTADYFRAFTADRGTDTIYESSSTGLHMLQIYLPSTTIRAMSFKQVGNDLVGSVTDGNSATYAFTVKDQYLNKNLQSIWLYSIGTPGSNGNGYILGGDLTDTVTDSKYWSFIAGTTGPDKFDMSASTRPGARLFGDEGADSVIAKKGMPVTFFGGLGIDTIVYPESASAHKITVSSTTVTTVFRTITSTSDYLNGVERIKFADGNLAFDLSASGNAGQALLLIGAVLGKDLMLTKRALMGSVIDLFDQGYTIEQLAGALMRLPIWAGTLTPTNSSTDITTYLLTRVNGRAPSAAELAAAVMSIESDVQGTFLANLAQTAPNITQVDLVGLGKTGFDYPLAG